MFSAAGTNPSRLSVPSLSLEPADNNRLAARWSKWLIVIAVLGVGVPWLVAAITGNLAIPHNDAWSYSRIAAMFARTGKVQLLGWNDMTLIGQIVMLGPLGRSIVVQQTAVALFALVALYCVYHLVGHSLTTRRALLATAMAAMWPGLASLATSFMTDIPALAGALLALALGRAALERDSRRLFALSLVVAFWAATVREQALAAPAAILVCGLFTHRSRERLNVATLLTAAVVFVILYGGFVHWRNGLPNGDNPQLAFSLGPFIRTLENMAPVYYLTLAAPLAPAAFLTAHPRNWRVGSWLAVAVVAALAVHFHTTHQGWSMSSYSTGNYLQASGEYQGVLSGSRSVVPGALWTLLTLLAWTGGAAMAGTLVERWRTVDPVLGLFTVFAALGQLAIAGATGQGSFDRYLLVLIPGALAVLLAPSVHSGGTVGQRKQEAAPDRLSTALRHGAAIAAGCLVLVISVALAANAFSFDSARWRNATKFVASGIPAERVNAGLEWLGWHSAQGFQAGLPANPDDFGWQPEMSAEPSCVIVVSSPLQPANAAQTKWTAIGIYSYRTYLVFGTSRLYAYATHASGCPAE